MNQIIVWDIETIPDLSGFAVANNLVGKTEAEVRAAHQEASLPGRHHPGMAGDIVSETVGDFKSEGWARSYRKGGRHRADSAPRSLVKNDATVAPNIDCAVDPTHRRGPARMSSSVAGILSIQNGFCVGFERRTKKEQTAEMIFSVVAKCKS